VMAQEPLWAARLQLQLLSMLAHNLVARCQAVSRVNSHALPYHNTTAHLEPLPERKCLQEASLSMFMQ
jgi:hypothetical protein